MKIYKSLSKSFKSLSHFKKSDELLWGDVLRLFNSLPNKPIFDLVVTSPPYNIGNLMRQIPPSMSILLIKEKLLNVLISW